MTDMLAVMLAAQRDVQLTLTGEDPGKLEGDRFADYMRTMGWSCADELHEAVNETGWKPWATSRHINREEFMGEMTDAWLFFMNLMLAGGMTADDLIDRTAKKQDNALARFAAKYDGVTTKCPLCKRAYDNDGVKCEPANDAHPNPICAYIAVPKPGVPSCPVCGHAYSNKPDWVGGCHQPGASGQGFGWCNVTKQSFDAAGVVSA